MKIGSGLPSGVRGSQKDRRERHPEHRTKDSSVSLFLTVNLGLPFKSVLSQHSCRLVSWLFQVVYLRLLREHRSAARLSDEIFNSANGLQLGEKCSH